MHDEVEYLDVLDESGNVTGKAESYHVVHQKGLIHRAVHVCLLNSRGELLLQKRSSAKLAYPDHWDISAAGHVSAGETSTEAAKKETAEELGVDLPEDAFEYLFTVREHVVLNGGTYIADEFQDVYLVRIDMSAEEFVLQESEVSDARWVPIPELMRWLRGEGEPIVPHDTEYWKLLERVASA